MNCPHCNHKISDASIAKHFAAIGGKASAGIPRPNRKQCAECGAVMRKDGGCTRCENKERKQ